ncbi:MAG TPA: hypothetical protein VFP54_02750 [Acidimicrobiales bacterium]|nr:hypothetical protein [Acidimicrobiales bacterium]
MAGRAHLVVRFQPASGVDLSVDPPQTTYDGPSDMAPAKPSAVAEVRRLGDFEGVNTWAIGLAERRPFEVVARSDQIVVRLAAAGVRATTCDSTGTRLRVGYPPGWYAELSARWACRYFDPQPFVVLPATDAVNWAVTAQPADAPAPAVISRLSAGASVQSHPTVTAGLPTTVLDVTEKGDGMYPAGYTYRVYVVATSPDAFTVMSSPAAPGPAAQRNRDAVDRLAEMLTTT